MWRTPQESAHGTGWLGDGTFAMLNEFGSLDADDQDVFTRYWSFAMLGLSLGGSGVLGFAGKTVGATRMAGRGRDLDFIAATPERGLSAAEMAIVGVKNARFGNLTASYAALPSGRVAMNIKGVGRIVAPPWESVPRLRLRLNAFRKEDIAALQERRATLSPYEAGFIHLPNGVTSQADAQKIVTRVLDLMGVSADRRKSLYSKIIFGADTSSFNAKREIRIASDIGRARNLKYNGNYNEFIAMTEVAHELTHARRLQEWLKKGKGSEADYWESAKQRNPAYFEEEVLVETTAREWTESLARPRIAAERHYGNDAEADRLESMLEEFIADSDAYIEFNSQRAGR